MQIGPTTHSDDGELLTVLPVRRLPDRVLPWLTFMFSILAFVFALGMNWAELTALKARVETIEKWRETELNGKYVPRELWQAQIDYLNKRLDTISDEIHQRNQDPRRK